MDNPVTISAYSKIDSFIHSLILFGLRKFEMFPSMAGNSAPGEHRWSHVFLTKTVCVYRFCSLQSFEDSHHITPLIRMFCRSLLASRHFVLSVQRATLSRQVFKPRVTRVLDKDGRPIGQDAHSLPAQKSLPNQKYDESFMFKEEEEETHFQDRSSQLQKVKFSNTNKTKDVPRYEKASDQNNPFKAMMVNLSLKKRRETMNLIVLEGKRLINDAIDAKIKLKYIYFTLEDHLRDIHNLEEIMATDGTKIMKVLYRDMKIFSSLVTAPGIMAVSEKPDFSKLAVDRSQQMPLTLVCDNIRDPGNLGTIIRSSAAAGVDKVLLTNGCVDPWNNKVIKSAAGAHFRIPLVTNVSWSSLTDHLPGGQAFDVFIADSKDHHHQQHTEKLAASLQSRDYFGVQFFEPGSSRRQQQQHKVLIIANEAFGPSSESYQLAQQCNGSRVTIPLYGNVESLNSAIASSILLFEIRKQYNSLQ